MQNLITITDVTLSAESSTPTFHMIAYNGGLLNGFKISNDFPYPMIVDLDGLSQTKEQVKLHRDHDSTNPVAHGTARNTGMRLEVSGPMLGTPGAKEIIEAARVGFQWEASISVGFSMKDVELMEAAQSFEVNGRSFEFDGPVGVIRKSTLREVTFTSLGADPTTEVRIAASLHKKESSMAEKKKDIKQDSDTKGQNEEYKAFLGWMNDRVGKPAVESMAAETLQAFHGDWQKMQAAESADLLKKATSKAKEEGDITEEDAKELLEAADSADTQTISASEQNKVNRAKLDMVRLYQRQRYVNTILSGHAEAQERAMLEEWDKTQCELEALRLNRSQGPYIQTARGLEGVENAAIACAMLRAHRAVPNKKTNPITGEEWGLEKWYTEDILDASDHPKLRNLNLHGLMDMQIRASGKTYTGSQKSHDFINETRRALQSVSMEAAGSTSTLTLTNIFDDIANKSLLAGYESQNTTWQEWCGIEPVPDFKTKKVYRMTPIGALQRSGGGGEIQHIRLSDVSYSVQADEYSAMIGLSRRDIINDDLGALTGMMTGLGVVAAQTIEEVAYVFLLGQIGASTALIFDTGGSNNNYETGANSTVSVEGYTQIETAFLNQVSANLTPIGIRPDRVLVGTNNRTNAFQLFNASEIREGRGGSSTTSEFTTNPHAGAYRPIVSPYINNTAIKIRSNIDPTSIGGAVTGQTSTGWFMFADPMSPQGACVYMALLNGNRTPIIEQSDQDFNVLGMQFRVFHDFNISAGDPVMGVHSKGAA